MNVVATAELNQFVDLDRLVHIEGFRYDPDIYRCAYLKDTRTRGKVSIFSMGKMIAAGSKSFDDARLDLEHGTRKLAALGLVKAIELTVKLQNVVATGDMGKSIDIEKLSTKLPSVIYEPEQFPGAIYYAEELEGASVLVFANGRVVFAGLKTNQLLDVAKQVLEGLSRLVLT